MLSSRGTSMPVDARTWMVRSPLFTVSVQMEERSTVGEAGLSRATATPAATAMAIPAAVQTMRRRRFFSLMSGRAMSIAEEYCTIRARVGKIVTDLKTAIYDTRTQLHLSLTDRFRSDGVRFRTVRNRLTT